jgi:prepilin peptidase CpaA
MNTTETLLLVGFVALYVLVAAVWDLRTRQIPNWLTGGGLIAGLAFHTVVGYLDGGMQNACTHLGWALLGGATGFGILFLMWLTGSGGGGDVKLMAALGAWLGARHTLYLFLLSALFAIPLALTAALFVGLRNRRNELPRNDEITTDTVAKNNNSRGLVPYAVPVALGAWVVLVIKLAVVAAHPALQQTVQQAAQTLPQ